MTAFLHPHDLSQSEHIKALEERFSLLGYARYLKALEVIAAEGESRQARMPRSAWEAALLAKPEPLQEFLDCCVECGALAVDDDGEQLAISVPGLSFPSDAQSVAPASTLYEKPEHWAAWFVDELGYPESLAYERTAMAMYRRWCVSRVSVGDMNAAVQRSVGEGTGIRHAELHRHLKALRAEQLREVEGW